MGNHNSVRDIALRPYKRSQFLRLKREEQQCVAILEGMGIVNYHAFSIPLRKVLLAISTRTDIDGFNIADAIQNQTFRFYTKDFPLLSLEASNALAESIREAKKPSIEFSRMGRQRRTENADDFAVRMHEIIGKLKTEERMSSYRETIKVLNEKEIPSPMGGRWHVRTLQDLNKRWQELGLSPPAYKLK